MDRRAFLKTTGSAAAVATTATAATAEAVKQTKPATAPAVAKGIKELRFAMTWVTSLSAIQLNIGFSGLEGMRPGPKR